MSHLGDHDRGVKTLELGGGFSPVGLKDLMKSTQRGAGHLNSRSAARTTIPRSNRAYRAVMVPRCIKLDLRP